MKNRIYERAVANNSVTDELLVKLGMLDSPAPVLKQVKKAGYSVV